MVRSGRTALQRVFAMVDVMSQDTTLDEIKKLRCDIESVFHMKVYCEVP
jgi:hypothetical protein